MRNYGPCACGRANRCIDVDSMVSIIIANLSLWLVLTGFGHEPYESEDSCRRPPFNKQRSNGKRQVEDGGKQSNKEGEGQARKQLAFSRTLHPPPPEFSLQGFHRLLVISYI